MWLNPKDRAILKARRKTHTSKGKSSLLQRSPASSKWESVADCNDQISLVEFVSSKDPAMVNAVEIPSASGTTGESGVMQRTEVRSHRRNDIPMKRGKAWDSVDDSGQKQAGDSGREKGGTQKFLPVHSQL